MKKLIALICLLALLPVTTTAAPLQLLDPPTKQLDASNKSAILQLLDTKWDRGSSNKLESKSIFAAVDQKQPELLVAYVLNRINHSSIDQALEVASETRLQFANNWDGRILEIWLLTLTNQYDTAIVQMRSLKKQLDVAKNNNRLPPSVTQNLYLRLGRLIGYLEGPVVDKVNSQLLAGSTVLLEQNVTPEVLKAFSLARQSVKAEYEQLLADQVAYQNQELKKVAASNEVEKQRLEADTKRKQEARARLEPELEKLTTEGHLLTSDLERQISSAGTALQSINQTAYGLEQQLAFLYLDLYSTNPRFVGSTIAIENEIYRVELDLSQQRVAASNQAAILTDLQNQLFAVRRNFQTQINQIKRNIKRVEVAEKRTSKKLQKIAVGPKIAGGKTQSLANRRTALKTYDDLPLELYRQEMLDAVRALDAGGQ